MKITAARRSRADIIRDYDAAMDRNEEREQSAKIMERLYKADKAKVLNSIKEAVEDELSPFSELYLDVSVGSRYVGGMGEYAIEVHVTSNNNRVHAEDKALSWDWTVWLDKDGEVAKESGSWSGLQAVNETQLESLRQTVACLEVLNSMDWKSLLNKSTPNYMDYMTQDYREGNDGETELLDKEMLEADIEDAMHTGALIKGTGYKYFPNRSTAYYRVISETPSRYKVDEVSALDVKRGTVTEDPSYYYNITKEKFFDIIDKPVRTVEV